MGDVIRIGIERVKCSNQLVDDFTTAMAAVTGSFEVREAKALELSNELVRRWIERDLQSMAQQFDDEVSVEGQRYRRHDAGARRYHTLCGTVVVQRDSYRLVGIHNGPTVVPLELQAGLLENATPALAFSITQGFAERPLRHYELEMHAAHRHTPSRSTLERIGKRIGGELRHLQARYAQVPLTVVQDGAPELWNLVDKLCDRHDLVADELFWHVQFGSIDGDPPPPFWRTRALRHISGEKLRIVSGHLEYFRNNRHRIRYATSRRRGLPIGSGPTEGACKSVVTMRFKRSGQRWFESGLAPCLSLRALHLSERLRPCFARLQAARSATLRAA